MGRAITGCAIVVAGILAAACSKPSAPVASDSLAHPVSTLDALANTSVPEPARVVSDEALAWMAGRWCGDDGEQQVEETWLMPYKDEAIGMSRTISGGRMISYEFMRIASLDGKLTLLAQPSGNPPVPFERTDGDKDWIRFENPKHDYPQRIEYRRVGDELHAEVGGPGANGQEEIIPYTYKRCVAP